MKKGYISRPISPLYARNLTSDEKQSLRAVSVDDVSSEINLLRVLIVHLMKIQQSAPKDMVSRIQTLRTCIMLNEQLAKLVRAHNKEHEPFAEWDDAITQAITELGPFFEEV